jgi:para-nitrobenzyl esterase
MARYAARFLETLGADPTRPETWRDVSAGTLVAAGNRLLGEVDGSDTGTIAFAPVIDGDLIPRAPVDEALAGRTAPVPLVIGTTRHEALLFLRARPHILPVTTERVDRVFDALAEQAGASSPLTPDPTELLTGYPGYPSREALLDLASDSTFRIPAIRLAQAHTRVAPVWMYRYDFATRSERMARLDATHGTEIPLVFDTLDAPVGRLIVMLGGRASAERLGSRIRTHLVEFVRRGRPAFGWPRYVVPERATLLLDRDLQIALDPRRRAREAWEGVEFLR